MFQRRRGAQRGNFGVMLLALQLYNYGLGRIPPVTLIAILGQVAIFLGFGDLSRWFPSSYDVCISTHLVWRQKQWSRMILGTLFHASDMHLYFNMVSLLWKGVFLEKRFKSQYFAYLLTVFTVLSSAIYVCMNLILSQVLDDRSYELTCAVGFSGVIFALKVLTTHYSPPGLHYALGFIPVPSKYIYWAELGLIQLIHPNASLTGHLAGILVGLLYVKGPLKMVMDSVIPPEPSYTYTSGNAGHRQSQRRGYNTTGYTTGGGNAGYGGSYGRGGGGGGPQGYEGPGGASGGQGNQDYGRGGGASQGFERFTGGLSEEEQMQQAMDESRRQNNPGTGNSGSRLYPDLDEIRRRRSERYT